jgi:hypothetical protein
MSFGCCVCITCKLLAHSRSPGRLPSMEFGCYIHMAKNTIGRWLGLGSPLGREAGLLLNHTMERHGADPSRATRKVITRYLSRDIRVTVSIAGRRRFSLTRTLSWFACLTFQFGLDNLLSQYYFARVYFAQVRKTPFPIATNNRRVIEESIRLFLTSQCTTAPRP